jgi:hypothetical protein
MDEEYLGQHATHEDQEHIYPERQVEPVTGDDRVDTSVAILARLPGIPVDEHVAVLEEVHGRLRDILGELDEPASPKAPGPQPKGPR